MSLHRLAGTAIGERHGRGRRSRDVPVAVAVAGLVVGNPRGWIPVGIAVLAILFQRLVSRDARRAQEAGTDPRDTLG